MNKKVVTELIQDQVTAEQIEKELKQLLFSTPVRLQMGTDYEKLRNQLHTGAKASEKAAEIIVRLSKNISASTSA
jgi:lipid A disaccharide synthetase